MTRSSKGTFTVNQRHDATEFLRWLVNALIMGLRDKTHSELIRSISNRNNHFRIVFQGPNRDNDDQIYSGIGESRL